MKKVRKGDVVVVKATAQIGLVDSAKSRLGCSEMVDVALDDAPGSFLYTVGTFSRSELEVIDHVDETNSKFKSKFKVGDVVMDKGFPLSPQPLTIVGVRNQNNTPYAITYQLLDASGGSYGMFEDDLLPYQIRVGDLEYELRAKVDPELTGTPKKFEENGYEYWLQHLNDKLCLMKQCKHCKSTHPTVVRILEGRDA